MTRVIAFPGLGLSLDIAREAFRIGPFTVYWYGVIVVAGIGLGLYYSLRRSREFGMNPDRMTDLTLYSVIAGLVGARAYYVAFTWDYYSQHPEEIIAIWKGGIAIYGGIIGAFALGIWLCRRWKMPVLPAADCAVGGLILGQAIGRWGNFVNIEAFGGNTTLPWGMTGDSIVHYLSSQQAALAEAGIPVDPWMPVHPTFFYESMWNLLGFLFIVWYTRRRRFNGELALFYCGWYGLGRAWIEGLRTDSLMLGGLRISQVVAALGVVLSLGLWLVCRERLKKGTAPVCLLRQSDEELAAQADAMAPKSKKGPPPSESGEGEPTNAAAGSPDRGEEAAESETQEEADGPNH